MPVFSRELAKEEDHPAHAGVVFFSFFKTPITSSNEMEIQPELNADESAKGMTLSLKADKNISLNSLASGQAGVVELLDTTFLIARQVVTAFLD